MDIPKFKEEKKIYGYKNIYFSPVHTTTLVKLIEKVLKKIEGIYNLGHQIKFQKQNLQKDLLLELDQIKV